MLAERLLLWLCVVLCPVVPCECVRRWETPLHIDVHGAGGVDATAVQDHICSARSSIRRHHPAAAASMATPTAATIGSAVCATFSHAFAVLFMVFRIYCPVETRISP